jgi:putative SOS response-associated peptidase YedK
LQIENHQFTPNKRVTSFNARDLNKPLWRDAAQHRRGLIFATELGERQGKDQYLMRSSSGFALGVGYKDWPKPQGGDALRSMAVITRPPHPCFSQYHDKSIPLFIQLEAELIKEWLSPSLITSPAIEHLLAHPTITSDLEVSRVRTYTHAERLSNEGQLAAD